MNLANREPVRVERDTDVTIDVVDDDLVDDEVRASRMSLHSALAPCPTKRVELTHYREAQEEARLAGLNLVGGDRISIS